MPIVSFMPYFPDQRVDLSIAGFNVWNWWLHRERLISSTSIRAYLDRYFGLYRRTNGDGEQRIAIISREGLPTFPEEAQFAEREIGRFASALMASHLFELPVDRDIAWAICSSDNFTALYQAFNPASGDPAIAFTFGSYIRTMVTGSWGHLTFTTPQFMPDLGPCRPQKAILSNLAALCSDVRDPANRLFRSLEWLRLAFANYEGLQPPVRIVAMCTAFETLLDFPDHEKGRHFAEAVNGYLPRNSLPRTTRALGPRRVAVSDSEVGWWCRDFYDFRSRIVHGEEIRPEEFRSPRGVEQLRIALSIFEECIRGLFVELGMMREEERGMEFLYSHLREQFGLPNSVWDP